MTESESMLKQLFESDEFKIHEERFQLWLKNSSENSKNPWLNKDNDNE